MGFIDPQRSALVTFKKTHTSAKIVTRLVSQAQYSVRLLHGQHEALKPPRSQAEILGLPDIYELPRTASSPKRSSRSAANPRSSASETGAGDKHGAHAHDHTDAERYCNARAAFVLSGAHSNGVRVDELIRTWLRDRRKIQQQREKKLKDQLRADRDFLKQLQVASGKKDEEVPALCPLPSRILFGAIIHHLMLSSDRHHGPQAEVSDEHGEGTPKWRRRERTTSAAAPSHRVALLLVTYCNASGVCCNNDGFRMQSVEAKLPPWPGNACCVA